MKTKNRNEYFYSTYRVPDTAGRVSWVGVAEEVHLYRLHDNEEASRAVAGDEDRDAVEFSSSVERSFDRDRRARLGQEPFDMFDRLF